MRNRIADLWNSVALNAEGGSGGEGGGDAPKTPESVLFPKEGEKPADQSAGDDAGKKDGEGGDKPADWKEYVSDPAKSDEENAAAKAEHDKTKPAEKSDADKVRDTIPEDGKYALTMPDGVQVDQELLDALGPKFAAKKMTNGEAQELADKFIEIQKGRDTKRAEDWGKTLTKWVDDAKADKDIGGDKWDGTVINAQKAVTKFGTPALKDYLEASGGGNHPELIRFMAAVGAMISEDNPANGGAEGAGQPADLAHVLFKNDAPKG